MHRERPAKLSFVRERRRRERQGRAHDSQHAALIAQQQKNVKSIQLRRRARLCYLLKPLCNQRPKLGKLHKQEATRRPPPSRERRTPFSQLCMSNALLKRRGLDSVLKGIQLGHGTLRNLSATVFVTRRRRCLRDARLPALKNRRRIPEIR